MTEDRISPRQAVAVGFVAVLSPLIRRFPRITAETAGAAAWLTVPAAVFLAFLLLLLCFARHNNPPSSASALLGATLGRGTGNAVLTLYTLWIVFYAGFLLRSGANRLVSTVYPRASPALFIVNTALPVLAAATGRLQPIARSAMLFRPLLIAVPAAAAALTAWDLDLHLLGPVTAADLLPVGLGALETVNVLSAGMYLLFLGDRLTAPVRTRDWMPWLGVMGGILAGMTVCCLGRFGPALTGKLSFPFFMLVRDVSVLGALERAEPVVVALWVFSDFVFIALLVYVAGDNLRVCFFRSSGRPAVRKLLCAACTASAAALGLLTGRSEQSFTLLSETLVPLVNAVMVFVLPLPIALIGALRRRK